MRRPSLFSSVRIQNLGSFRISDHSESLGNSEILTYASHFENVAFVLDPRNQSMPVKWCPGLGPGRVALDHARAYRMACNALNMR